MQKAAAEPKIRVEKMRKVEMILPTKVLVNLEVLKNCKIKLLFFEIKFSF